ncbi:MAG TPA: IPT/TIG domain-containing protein, partial [Dyella sp.]|nr:IPT/TIG domain-containing protein [Dyella sp.]
MESQGSRRATRRIHVRQALRRWSYRTSALSLFAWVLVFCASVGLDGAHAQTTYVHDADGRVVAVTQSTGTTQQYTYDTLGHPAQVTAPISSNQLAIFAFMPTHGIAGTEVTLQGQGFSSNAASDTVSFNGATATVLSASSTQLVVSVPGGATTGPISVTVGGQTATSAQSFVMDTGDAPTITAVTPVVAVGGTVTVSGTNLAPFAADTTVQMAGLNMTGISSLSNTQLQYLVPSNAISGHVAVQTLYGSATSATPVA